MVSAGSLLYDFTAEELSMLVRGCAFLGYVPDEEFLLGFWMDSEARLREASAAQLANIAWGVAMLGLDPPTQWSDVLHSQLNRKAEQLDRWVGWWAFVVVRCGNWDLVGSFRKDRVWPGGWVGGCIS